MAKREIAPTAEAAEALTVLGAHIRYARHQRNWTAENLAGRIGVSARTVTAIEAGKPGVAIGSVFNAASVVGVPLFGADRAELARLRHVAQERVALIPSREYQPRTTENDDALNF